MLRSLHTPLFHALLILKSCGWCPSDLNLMLRRSVWSRIFWNNAEWLGHSAPGCPMTGTVQMIAAKCKGGYSLATPTQVVSKFTLRTIASPSPSK
ncbi:hypothetical protein F5882DRAFT_409549 [Hyaloscypha sp. PMI_1271]|nr:hypothetical protein F5882DRAFT_409549 [Hyaloscypha sp. PMI_1271]